MGSPSRPLTPHRGGHRLSNSRASVALYPMRAFKGATVASRGSPKPQGTAGAL